MKLSGDNGRWWSAGGKGSGGIIANAKAKTSLHASLVVAARVWKSFSLFIFYDYFTTFIVRSSRSCISIGHSFVVVIHNSYYGTLHCLFGAGSAWCDGRFWVDWYLGDDCSDFLISSFIEQAAGRENIHCATRRLRNIDNSLFGDNHHMLITGYLYLPQCIPTSIIPSAFLCSLTQRRVINCDKVVRHIYQLSRSLDRAHYRTH